MTDKNTYRKSFLIVALVIGVVSSILLSIGNLKIGGTGIVIPGILYFLLVFIIWKSWDYIIVSYDELTKKVSWPTWSQIQSSSVVVAIASLIIALIIFIMDQLFESVMKLFY